MNFEQDLSSADSYLDGRVVLSLVLLREWSRIEEGSVATVRGCAFVLEQLKRLSTASAEHEELVRRNHLQLSDVSHVFVTCAPVTWCAIPPSRVCTGASGVLPAAVDGKGENGGGVRPSARRKVSATHTQSRTDANPLC